MTSDASPPHPDRDPSTPAGPDDPTRVGDPRTAGPEDPTRASAPIGAPTRVADPIAPPDDRRRSGLYRSPSDRVLAGVCGGIAERYGIEAVLVRLAFVASLLLGGAGILFYVAAAIVIPNPPADRDGNPVPITTSATTGVVQVLVVMALAFAALVGLIAVAGVAFVATVFFGAWPAAVVLVLLAVTLALVARGGRRSAATLLVLLVAVAVPAGAAIAADLQVDRSAGERLATPTVAAEAADGFRLGVGELTVDLRDLPVARGDAPLTVPVRVDLGRAAIVLPPNRCVAWTIRTTVGVAGDVDVLGVSRREGWIGHRQDRTFRIDPGDDRPQVTVDAHVGVGEIVVADSRRAIDRRPARAADSGRSTIRTDACRASGRR